MKTIVLLALLSIISPLTPLAQTPMAVGQFVVINAASTTPAVLTNATIKAISITLIGRKANRTDNTGTVWVGFQSADDSQPIKVAAGATVGISIPAGRSIVLSSLYLDVETNNDGVLVLYE